MNSELIRIVFACVGFGACVALIVISIIRLCSKDESK